jgi:hypothetical protein
MQRFMGKMCLTSFFLGRISTNVRQESISEPGFKPSLSISFHSLAPFVAFVSSLIIGLILHHDVFHTPLNLRSKASPERLPTLYECLNCHQTDLVPSSVKFEQALAAV